jgi:cytochrome b561
MPRSDPTARYTAVAIALHWAIAVLVVAQIAGGWWMLGIPKQPPGPRVDAFNLHKSVGLAILALMLVRVVWRIGHRPPASPPMPAWQAAAARATHLLLYAALLAQPIAGYLGSAWSGYPVKFFGLALPAWAAKDAALKDLMSGVHLATSWVIVAAVAVHAAAALKHALIDRDGLLARMGIGRSG